MPKKDFTQVAFAVVQQATGEMPKPTKTPRQENSRKGGLKGGVSRMNNLTDDEKTELARKAAGSVALATYERDFGRDECYFLKLDGFALPMHKTARQKTA